MLQIRYFTLTILPVKNKLQYYNSQITHKRDKFSNLSCSLLLHIQKSVHIIFIDDQVNDCEMVIHPIFIKTNHKLLFQLHSKHRMLTRNAFRKTTTAVIWNIMQDYYE